MPSSNTFPATDSAEALRPILGDDATATFEDDPTFVESKPTGTASSENVEVQKARSTPDDDDVDDEDELEDDEEDDDLDDEDEDDDEDDLDEADDDDFEDEDDDEEDEDDDEEDDADEVTASSVLRADGLLGYEDEADDARDGKSRKQGDHDRAEAEKEEWDGEKSFDPNSHEDGKWEPIEKDNTPEAEGALIEHRNDDPTFIKPYRAAALAQAAGMPASVSL